MSDEIKEPTNKNNIKEILKYFNEVDRINKKIKTELLNNNKIKNIDKYSTYDYKKINFTNKTKEINVKVNDKIYTYELGSREYCKETIFKITSELKNATKKFGIVEYDEINKILNRNGAVLSRVTDDKKIDYRNII